MNSKNKIGMFSVLIFGVMMLLIPATSIASAQEYEDRFGKINDLYYDDARDSNENELYNNNEYSYGYSYNDNRYYQDEKYNTDHSKDRNYEEKNNRDKFTLSEEEIKLINKIFEQSGKPFELEQVSDGFLLTNTELGESQFIGIGIVEALPIIAVVIAFMAMGG